MAAKQPQAFRIMHLGAKPARGPAEVNWGKVAES
ncbi:MAG: hypothetical protein JWM35_2365 [Verrucomicrobia bacterium]|nr:hypothetical protein [Verrucomicrobiota bacterium]